MKIQLTFKQVLEYIILGIKNGKYQAAINLAQDYIDGIDDKCQKDIKTSRCTNCDE